MGLDVREALGITELRARFLRYTRAAYARIPRPQRVLDIGCGRGTSLLQLADLHGGQLVGIDIEASAVAELTQRLEREGLHGRVQMSVCSLLDTPFSDGSFDLLWEEGVLHLLELDRGLAECHRLLRPGGHLVSAEAVDWNRRHSDAFVRAGFEEVGSLPWPRGCWWTEYYAPLERRLAELRTRLEGPDRAALEPYEREVAMVKADPAAADCGHTLFIRR